MKKILALDFMFFIVLDKLLNSVIKCCRIDEACNMPTKLVFISGGVLDGKRKSKVV